MRAALLCGLLALCAGCRSGVDIVKALTDDLKTKAVTYEHVDKAIIIKAPSMSSGSDTSFIELVFGTREVRWSSAPILAKEQRIAPVGIGTTYKDVSLFWPAGTVYQMQSIGMPLSADMLPDSPSTHKETP